MAFSLQRVCFSFFEKRRRSADLFAELSTLKRVGADHSGSRRAFASGIVGFRLSLNGGAPLRSA